MSRCRRCKPEPGRTTREAAKCHGKRIGILIVTYNAVTTLTKVLKRITPNVWDNVEEIAIFDDASQDATYELAMGIKTLRQLPKLAVLKHEQNLGYGGNQKAGYRYFMEKGFDIVVLLHGDGQYAPEILAHMYQPIVAGEADAVFGSRMMKTYGGPLKGGMPLYKYLGNRILSIFENAALGLNLTEFHSGYRAYSLAALRNIDFTHMTNDFHFDTEIIIKLHHQGFKIDEVPIPTYYGNEICYVNGMRYARDVFRAVRPLPAHLPLRGALSGIRRILRPLPDQAQPLFQPRLREEAGGQQSRGPGYRLRRRRFRGGAEEKRQPRHRRGSASRSPSTRTPSSSTSAPTWTMESRRWWSGSGDKRFDRVLLLDILEHLRSPERILRECRALLGATGR